MAALILAFVLLFRLAAAQPDVQCHFQDGGLPDTTCTPGSTDPRVTQDTIAETICVPGYTATVRPSTRVTNAIKRDRMAAYGISDQPLSLYELDHLIPLELGGNPDDPANLWPEPWLGAEGAHAKDVVENELHRAVCDGVLPLADAQARMATNWQVEYVPPAPGLPACS